MLHHLFSCGRHGEGVYVPTCEHCDKAKQRYWASKKPVKNLPMPDAARRTDPQTAHEGVKRIHKTTGNQSAVLALDYSTPLHYREIADRSGVYPTAVSRVITTLVRDGRLKIAGERDGCQTYIKTASSGGPVSLGEEGNS